MTLQVRPADLDDWKIIVQFNMQLAAETENKQLNPSRIASGVKAILADERHGHYHVACLDSRIVGQMMYTREWSDWRNGEIWWLQSVYVDPGFRRQGVFRALYGHLKQLSENTPGVVGLRLYVEQHNAKAIETYKKLGMTDAGYTVMEKMTGQLFE